MVQLSGDDEADELLIALVVVIANLALILCESSLPQLYLVEHSLQNSGRSRCEFVQRSMRHALVRLLLGYPLRLFCGPSTLTRSVNLLRNPSPGHRPRSTLPRRATTSLGRHRTHTTRTGYLHPRLPQLGRNTGCRQTARGTYRHAGCVYKVKAV